ncbi:hypothetical protein RHMOL_Rhmol13G0140300 [Rhododendron molle]|uniref:Uncharacterized protein n=1 Tax=Rhododendron molle TaxID=49168 RepID=A0ACC0L6L8_RHOML|nr:hypothetical protein RHMOL_Rhmol13G0140300 [Rhododendron molle]
MDQIFIYLIDPKFPIFVSLPIEMGSIIRFFEDKTLLVTGGTGFLAKIMVEKILRIQPNVKKLFLLIRAKDAAAGSATQRFHDEIIKVIPVSGDVTCEDLISLEESDLRDELWRDIDVIVHSAATTKFDERYDIAMGINVMGAMHVLNFAKKCTNIKMLLHVSTAYVCGERDGVILKRLFAMGETLNGTSGLDIWVEKQLVEEKLRDVRAEEATEKAVTAAMKDFGIQSTLHLKSPGRSVFHGVIPPIILYSFPQKKHNGLLKLPKRRTMDVFALGVGKGKLSCLLFDPESVADMVFKLLNVALCHCPKATYINQERKMKFLLRLVELYMPYLFFKGIFDDLNTEKLRMEARESGGEEEGVFYFDPKCIDWEQYFMNIHFPGVVKYLF